MEVKVDKGAVRVTNASLPITPVPVSTGTTGIIVIAPVTRVLVRGANVNTKCVNIKNIGANDVWIGYNNLIDNTNSQILNRRCVIIISNYIGGIWAYSVLGTTIDYGVLELP